MLRKCAVLLAFLTLTGTVWPQGLNVPPGVTKDDWEEVNFEFNSSVLVDGFPSLLRLAELLQMNQGYKVRVAGHTDVIGGTPYNDRLGLARANAVRDFLVKYGAMPSQIEATSEGKANPRYPGQKEVYTKTDEARYMNRRVSLTVLDANGKPVSAGGAGEAIRALQPQPAAGLNDCCNEVLKKLDKLDDIAKMLKDLGDQNADLKKQLDGLRQAQQVLESKVNQPPPPAPPAPPTAAEVGQAVAREIEAKKQPLFSMLGMNVGMDDTGNTTFSGKGRFFAPIGSGFAIQAEAEYLYYKTDREGQFDIGMVDRIGRFQAGLFASLKRADLTQFQHGGTLGQGAVTLDYIFKRGTLGVFGTKGFLTSSLVNTVNARDPVSGALLNHLFLDSYLSIVDQAGVNAQVGLWGNNYIEGNVGYLHGIQAGNRFGGTARFVFPLNSKIAFTAEGGINETLLEPHNSGRAVVGLQFGNMLRPKELLAANHAVPAQIPRVRYEVITKLRRDGDDPPVADAGPNQVNVPAGLIQLNGSGSYSPDGNPITYQWTQSGGPPVTLSSPTSATSTFTAIAGQMYSFRLTVKDNFGLQSSAYVTITTKEATPVPTIGFFVANPPSISTGQSTTLSWNVTNATGVTISGVNGNLALNGSTSVSPTVTTTYTLTATNGSGQSTANVTVIVAAPQLTFQSCYASPTNIMAGESATLNWNVTPATGVSVSISQGVGAVATSGNFAVSPTTNTTYLITATGPGGATATCNIAVTVTPGQVPRIIQFAASPANINGGQSTQLIWDVENATSVSINNGVGTVALTGQLTVSPATTTTYTLTATNAAGSVTANATITVKVIPLPVITSFTASPTTSPSPGSKVTLTCATQNAVNVNIAGGMFLGATDSLPVFPTTTTTYTCIATNQLGQVAQQSVTVVVPPPPPNTGAAPVVVFATGNTITTTVRTLTLDASGSSSPAGNTPLTYFWSVAAGNGAGVTNPTGPLAQVTLGVPDGEYDFQVVVTDSKGNSSSGVIHVMLVPNVVTN